jgi:ABC-type amino acid transport substrate-binding protein
MNEFLKLNNNLGLGFTFRKGEKKLDYDFKIKIDKVIVKLIQNGKIDIDTLRVFK